MTLSTFIPHLLWMGTLLLVAGGLWATRRWLLIAGRRSPLTRDLLRPPAWSLRARLEDLHWDAAAWLSVILTAPPVFYAVFLQQRSDGGSPSGGTGAVVAVAAFAVVAAAGWKLYRLFKESLRVRLGMEAELAAAEELNRLMRDGFGVFHDVPGDARFNVDHVVVGPTGVFAVETKGRSKPTGREQRDGHRVQYDGRALVFPGWRETAPIDQAIRNADWLRKWLSSAVGEAVKVQPVLVLPGWYVHRTSGEGIPVLNGKDARGYFTRARGPALSAKLVQQIAHQLEQRCRDVAARAYAQADSPADRPIG